MAHQLETRLFPCPPAGEDGLVIRWRACRSYDATIARADGIARHYGLPAEVTRDRRDPLAMEMRAVFATGGLRVRPLESAYRASPPSYANYLERVHDAWDDLRFAEAHCAWSARRERPRWLRAKAEREQRRDEAIRAAWDIYYDSLPEPGRREVDQLLRRSPMVMSTNAM